MKVKSLGHFSQTTKMPCPSYSLSAFDCITTDPICIKLCYAKKHHYNYRVVKEALSINKNKYMLKKWVNNFTKYLELQELKVFRWFDSGDLASIIMLEKICEIADKNLNIKFWLPTRRDDLLMAIWEANNGKKFNKRYPNLSIRLSGKDLEETPDIKLCELLGVNWSVVTENKDKFTCLSSLQEGKCLSCRKCWDLNIKEVVYLKH